VALEVLALVTHDCPGLRPGGLGARRGRGGAPSLAVLARVIAPALRWGRESLAREVAAYRARFEGERASQRQLANELTDAERLAAVNLRTLNMAAAR
jgi:hypothetical protein